MSNIRNFCIIAHIDHGKTTLADRLLEFTKTVSKREMREQFLDQMDLERERGITIKLQPVRMDFSFEGKNYIFNLIDTPGHVDFHYEVSRSLTACEGAILLVDASQGIEAQTLSNLYKALNNNLEIIPVVNKIDLKEAQTEKVKRALAELLGIKDEEIILASGKKGIGIEEIIKAIITKIPPPKTSPDFAGLKALIFDSLFDEFKGVMAHIRIFGGYLEKGDKIKFLGTKAAADVLEVGVFSPQRKPTEKLYAGEVGYVATGLKEIKSCRVGDTISKEGDNIEALPGYQEVKPMVFASLFTVSGEKQEELREALEKLQLNDAALTFSPESFRALGYGFRCGFLGVLHLEIVLERLKREFNLEVVVTVPSPAYQVISKNNHNNLVTNPLEFPDPSQIKNVLEPWMKIDILTPKNFLGPLMELVKAKRGESQGFEYPFLEKKDTQLVIKAGIPLYSLLSDFYDRLKSVSKGFASLNYEFWEYRETEVRLLEILVADENIEALSTIVYEDSAYQEARKIVKALKEVIPRALFEVKIQASIGGKIIAAERIPPLRKDVTAKLYGGDITRKMKLLQKQKKGKKRMKEMGRVNIPPEAFLKILKR